MSRRIAAVILSLTLLLPSLGRAAELIMFEQEGCQYCRMWDNVIAPIYPKTSEGEAAPLRRLDIRDQGEIPYLKSRILFTPTFVLVNNDQEIGRIEGYPGEDFFWGLLGMMLQDLEKLGDSDT